MQSRPLGRVRSVARAAGERRPDGRRRHARRPPEGASRRVGRLEAVWGRPCGPRSDKGCRDHRRGLDGRASPPAVRSTSGHPSPLGHAHTLAAPRIAGRSPAACSQHRDSFACHHEDLPRVPSPWEERDRERDATPPDEPRRRALSGEGTALTSPPARPLPSGEVRRTDGRPSRSTGARLNAREIAAAPPTSRPGSPPRGSAPRRSRRPRPRARRCAARP